MVIFQSLCSYQTIYNTLIQAFHWNNFQTTLLLWRKKLKNHDAVHSCNSDSLNCGNSTISEIHERTICVFIYKNILFIWKLENLEIVNNLWINKLSTITIVFFEFNFVLPCEEKWQIWNKHKSLLRYMWVSWHCVQQ